MISHMRWIVSALSLLLLIGCASYGPSAIDASRTDYNKVLRKTEDEQLLLNLVRLRYRERPLFLELTALNTQFRFAAGGGAVAEGGDDSRYGVNGNVVVQETPTVTYTPLKGADFVQRMLSPISLDTLFLLDTSGWSTERVFRVAVEQMNGIKNATRADGPTPDLAPEFEEFIAVTLLMRDLEVLDLVEGARAGDAIYLRFARAALETQTYLELMKLLDLEPSLRRFRVTSYVGDRPANTINLRFRSLVGIMYFLSQSVEVPPADLDAVTVTRSPDGTPFDWSRVTGGLMRIRHSETRPERAAVAVTYRSTWFYIDETDLDSKSTFSLLGQLFALQAGQTEGLTPVLTLPVGS